MPLATVVMEIIEHWQLLVAVYSIVVSYTDLSDL